MRRGPWSSRAGDVPRAQQTLLDLPRHVLPVGEDARAPLVHRVAEDERIGRLAALGGELLQPGLLRFQNRPPTVGDLQQARRELAGGGDARLLHTQRR